MNFTLLDWIIIFVYLGFTISVGLYAKRFVGDLSGYLVAYFRSHYNDSIFPGRPYRFYYRRIKKTQGYDYTRVLWFTLQPPGENSGWIYSFHWRSPEHGRIFETGWYFLKPCNGFRR